MITLEHGSGGVLSRKLTEELIYPLFKGEAFPELSDASAFCLKGKTFLTTDTYVVEPCFFPGGDIGKLAVCGTCNDLAVAGARPRYLTLSLVIEEGFAVKDLKKILISVKKTADEIDVQIISGDTKVVPKGKGGGIFVNTSGVGEEITHREHILSPQNLQDGDVILVSAPIGAHGMAILAARESLPVASGLRSDCAHLYPLCESLCSLGNELRFMRDATRGGAAAVLNEMVKDIGLGLHVVEELFPIADEVAAAADILGLNPFEIANEGVMIAAVSEKFSEQALNLLKKHDLGRHAGKVGVINTIHPGKVILETKIGGRRILDSPRGLLLPRIC